MRVIPAPPGLEEPKPKRSARARATAKGSRVERLAQDMFEALGYWVEPAPKVVIRVPASPKLAAIFHVNPGDIVNMTRRHDFFGIWDLIVVWRGERRFVQVTDEHNRTARRSKILASGFPVSEYDLLLAYAGRLRFRVFPGPGFDVETDEMRVLLKPPRPPDL